MSMYKTSFPTISLTGHIHSIFIKKTISVGKFLKKCGKICIFPTDYIILRPCLRSQ